MKSFAAHETEVYDAVLEARTQLMNASTMQDKADADAALDAALTQLNVVVEAYPELKSDTTYIGLMDELAGSENRISTARKDYNEVGAFLQPENRHIPNQHSGEYVWLYKG